MGILFRNSQGIETPVAGLAPAGQLVPSVSLYQNGSTTAVTILANSKTDGRITFTDVMPDVNYQVILATNGTEGGITYSVWNKDVYGFNYTIVNNNNLDLSISLQWTAFKLMTDEVTALDEAKIEQNTKNIAPNFSATSSYAVGDFVTYNSVLYRCTTAHTAGAWVAGHFTQVTVGGTLGNIVPSDASASNKLVTESENNFKYQVITTDSDLNNIKTSGTYSIYISDPTSQATNHAPTYGWLQLSVIQMNNSQTFCNQVLYSADGKMFMRECGNNTWSAWQQIAVNTVSTMTVTKQGNYINGTNYHGCKVGKVATIEINGDTGSSIPWERIVTVGVATAGAAPLTELKCTADMLSVTTGYDLGGNAIIRQLLPYCRAWIGNNGNIQVFLANPGSTATSYTGNLFIGGSYITQ